MRRVVQFLPYVSRGLTICAVLAGLAAGLLEATFGAGFVCFDTCPTRAIYFAQLGPTAVQLMMPCVVLEALAMAAFLAYGLATRQARRAVSSLLVLLVGVAALTALAQHAQATLPVWGDGEGDRPPFRDSTGSMGEGVGTGPHARRRRLVGRPGLPEMGSLSDRSTPPQRRAATSALRTQQS
jgi:hypothetical protein